ncbi:MAG: aldehyde dehydrogenase [Flavobacteriaceae bacterium]|nr:aldehyde dehydrogenase [Flavobacteriaceae bacterium]
MQKITNYINGKAAEPTAGNYLDNPNPATGKTYSLCPDSDAADVQLAVEAALAAKTSWANTTAEQKFQVMSKIADLIDRDNERLALAETTDQGKPLWLSRNEVTRAAQNFRFYATATMQMASEAHITENQAVNYTIRQPIGVVGCISPWNLPLYLFTWKIAPALAAGNCVVAKPSEVTPMTAYLLGELCIEAGLPAGVLNIVHGLGPKVGQALVEHPQVKAISFTGGSATGKHLAATAAPMLKKLSLELGGKNPNIIFADCDLEKTLKTSINSSFLNQGEICLCGSRIYIERSLFETFKTRFLELVKRLKTGNPLEDDTRIGAIVSQQHFDKVMACIAIAKAEGGNILTGGNSVQLEGELADGWYIQPTVFEGLSVDCKTQQEEIFGPVVTLTPFDTEEEAIALANSNSYGLAASIWTENLSRAHRVSAAVDSGIIWVNCWLYRDLRTPFGGMKNSGVGREGGWEAIRFFTEAKNICIKL